MQRRQVLERREGVSKFCNYQSLRRDLIQKIEREFVISFSFVGINFSFINDSLENYKLATQESHKEHFKGFRFRGELLWFRQKVPLQLYKDPCTERVVLHAAMFRSGAPRCDSEGTSFLRDLELDGLLRVGSGCGRGSLRMPLGRDSFLPALRSLFPSSQLAWGTHISSTMMLCFITSRDLTAPSSHCRKLVEAEIELPFVLLFFSTQSVIADWHMNGKICTQDLWVQSLHAFLAWTWWRMIFVARLCPFPTTVVTHSIDL